MCPSPDSADPRSNAASNLRNLEVWRGRTLVAIAVIALVPVPAWWVQRAIDAPANGWFAGSTTYGLGNDFVVFHTAGVMVAEGLTDTLYDDSVFWENVERRTGRGQPTPAPPFGHPPAFAAAMSVLSGMSWQTGYLVWTLASLAAMAAALTLLGAPRISLLIGGLLLTLPAYFVITFGQASFFWLLILAGVFYSFRRGHIAIGGAVAGLLLLKPPLMAGFAVWFLLDRRVRSAVVSMALSAMALIGLTSPLAGRVWLDYPGAVTNFSQQHGALEFQWAQASPWSFFELLFPGSIAAAVGGALLAVAGVLVFVWFYRRSGGEWELMFVAATALTLWISPHLLLPDWVLLIAPGLVLWQVRPKERQTWLAIGIALAGVSMVSVFLTDAMTVNFGWALQIAVPSLGLAFWRVARSLTPASAD